MNRKGSPDTSRRPDATTPPSSVNAPPPKRYKVVVVDDSEICLEQVKYVLEENGFAVVTVNSPFGLSSALLRERPDLALVDITMPGLQGDKLVEIVMRHHDKMRQCPIVLYSDRPTEQLQTLAKNCGAAGYIRKTGDESLLVRSVRRFLPTA